MSTVKDHIALCRERMRISALRAGRSFEDVALVVVTKGVELPLICEALDCGVTHIGESRLQEAMIKYDFVNHYAGKNNRVVCWHMIGHLQTNKAKEAVGFFDLIHSVDSERLVQRIDLEAQKRGKVQDVLLQVNVSGEPSKFGFSPGTLPVVLKWISGLAHIKVRGLMTIAPLTDDLKISRDCFRRFRELRDQMYNKGFSSLSALSMGMSHDFEAAIEEGATFVRVGTAIFGERSR